MAYTVMHSLRVGFLAILLVTFSAPWQEVLAKKDVKNEKLSAEVRWFYAGAVPGSIQKTWFSNIAIEVTTDPPREDTYLVLRELTKIGIKIRGAEHKKTRELEIKVQIGSEELNASDGRPIGQITKWKKYEWNIEENQLGAKREEYQIVQKRRIKGTVAPRGWKACGVEITEITPLPIAAKKEGHYWSLAFEVKDDLSDSKPRLEACVNEAFTQPGYMKDKMPSMDNSHSYPEWFAK